MAIADVYNKDGEKVSQLDLEDQVFKVPVKPHVLHEVVTMQLANRRAGTVATKGVLMFVAVGKSLTARRARVVLGLDLEVLRCGVEAVRLLVRAHVITAIRYPKKCATGP